MTTEQRDRFWAKRAIDPQTKCWNWTGRLTRGGYGILTGNGRNVYAHRIAHEHWLGPIPEGHQVDHLCRNPRCVNPLHLEAVTPRENSRRTHTSVSALNAAKTHCPHGHEYNAKNTRWQIARSRVCRTCHNLRVTRKLSELMQTNK